MGTALRVFLGALLTNASDHAPGEEIWGWPKEESTMTRAAILFMFIFICLQTDAC